ncbi:MAG: hypothetical protein P4L67_01415 [Candidatus Pacebacteria bacterium]|nr:hypothetical protein [Candidatus Paceibacterota bacterium]
MIDVKKLISGFLILAAAAVGSGLILSFAGTLTSPSGAKTAAGPKIAGIGSALGTSSGSAGMNAFVDTGSLQGNAAEVLSAIQTTSTAAVASDPNNLTNVFADSFLNGLVAANPNGATVDSSGNSNFNEPDTQAVAQALSSDPSFTNFKAPDWDAEVAKIKITTTGDNSSESIATYTAAFNDIYQKYIISTNIGGVLGQKNSADAPAVISQIQETLQAAAAIPTPSSMVGLQQSFIKLLVYEKNSAQLVSMAATDPLKASLTFQGEQTKYDLAISDFSGRWSRFAATTKTSTLLNNSPQSKAVAFINDFLGIPTAHAQWVVTDPGVIALNTAQLGKMIEQYVEDIALQILINVLTNLIQRKVLTWVQGSGTPRFVTDFGTQMVNSFQTAAVNKINNLVTECIPSYQAPSVNLLLSTPSVAQKNSCLAQFNGQLNNNLQNFYNHFDNLTNYLSLFQPGGNIWSLTVQTRDAAVIAGSQNQQAQQTQTTAQQGWIGSSKCADGSDPNGSHYTCPDGGTLDGTMCDPTPSATNCSADATTVCDSSLSLPTNAVLVTNNGSCASTGAAPKVTSPGQATGQGFFSGLKSGAENITSAKNIAGLLNALTSSLLNSLAQAAISYSTKELDGLTNGGTGSGASDSGVIGVSSSSMVFSTPSSTTATQCIPSIQSTFLNASTSQASVSFSAAGAAIDSNCAAGGNCPANENSDGTPIYTWSAPGSLNYGNGATPTGNSFFAAYSATGTYYVTATASTDNTAATCEVDVQ